MPGVLQARRIAQLSLAPTRISTTCEKAVEEVRIDLQGTAIVREIDVNRRSIGTRKLTASTMKVIAPAFFARHVPLLGQVFRMAEGATVREVGTVPAQARLHDMPEPHLPAFMADERHQRPNFL